MRDARVLSPAIPTAASGANEEADKPHHGQDDGHNPQEVNGETDAEEEQGEQRQNDDRKHFNLLKLRRRPVRGVT
jgi:hypothetical protein